MTEIGQTRAFQIYIDGTAQASAPVYYDTKLESGLYSVRITDVISVSDPLTNVSFELRSSNLVNSLGNLPYFTYQQYTGSYTAPFNLSYYDFGNINLEQRIDLWIVDRSTGLPHADYQYGVITFEVIKIA